jgi:hypothetical protein
MQSQRMFPAGVWMRMQRWPMPNLGSVHMEWNRESSGKAFHLFVWFEVLRALRVVKDCPVGGTNWRGSSQIRHEVRRLGFEVSNLEGC